MAKDPAFLFYSDRFYSGTRTMLPEERACYIDLLIYQHQKGIIPNDTKRILMFCTGVDEATLKATLKAKFKQTNKGWVNEVLENVVSERKTYKKTQSENGKIGQFWKKSKQILSKKDFLILKKTMGSNDILYFLKNNEINKGTLKGSLKRCLSTRVKDVNVNKDINENEIFEKGVEKTFEACLEFFPEHLQPKNPKSWKDTIDKLNRLDGIPFDKIIEITQKTREDTFWAKNFLTLNKLRQKNKEGIKYIVVFNENIKANGKRKQNPKGASDELRRKIATGLGVVQP